MPVIHKLTVVYKAVYILANKISKRDRYGIYLKIETVALDALALGLEAALLSKGEKRPSLRALSIKIELLKHLLRVAHEVNAIDQRHYIAIEAELYELSKMVSGWLKYVHANSA